MTTAEDKPSPTKCRAISQTDGKKCQSFALSTGRDLCAEHDGLVPKCSAIAQTTGVRCRQWQNLGEDGMCAAHSELKVAKSTAKDVLERARRLAQEERDRIRIEFSTHSERMRDAKKELVEAQSALEPLACLAAARRHLEAFETTLGNYEVARVWVEIARELRLRTYTKREPGER